MARKNFGVGIGRPKLPTVAKMAKPSSASPMEAFKPAVPAAAFKRGGKVSYHDDPKFCGGGSAKRR